MEFRFNVNEIFKHPITEINASLIPPGINLADKRTLWDAVSKVADVVNSMGEASATAQGLQKPITSSDRLRNSDHRLYLLIDQASNNGRGAITGMLKTGKKGLYVFDRDGHHYQVQPSCVLDFYIHESKQRMGLGKQLFEHMLESEKVEPVKMAIDRPSDKFLGFLNKHYSLENPVRQMNNFVVYDGFFPEPSKKEEVSENNNTPAGRSNQPANGLQANFTSPYGRYGAPRPPCSMGQIIHNQSPLAQQTQEQTGLNIRTASRAQSAYSDKRQANSNGNRNMPNQYGNQNAYIQSNLQYHQHQNPQFQHQQQQQFQNQQQQQYQNQEYQIQQQQYQNQPNEFPNQQDMSQSQYPHTDVPQEFYQNAAPQQNLGAGIGYAAMQNTPVQQNEMNQNAQQQYQYPSVAMMNEAQYSPQTQQYTQQNIQPVPQPQNVQPIQQTMYETEMQPQRKKSVQFVPSAYEQRYIQPIPDNNQTKSLPNVPYQQPVQAVNQANVQGVTDISPMYQEQPMHQNASIAQSQIAMQNMQQQIYAQTPRTQQLQQAAYQSQQLPQGAYDSQQINRQINRHHHPISRPQSQQITEHLQPVQAATSVPLDQSTNMHRHISAHQQNIMNAQNQQVLQRNQSVVNIPSNVRPQSAMNPHSQVAGTNQNIGNALPNVHPQNVINYQTQQTLGNNPSSGYYRAATPVGNTPAPTTQDKTTFQNPQNYQRTATPSTPNVLSQNQFPRQNASQQYMVRPQGYPQAPPQTDPGTIPPVEQMSNPVNNTPSAGYYRGATPVGNSPAQHATNTIPNSANYQHIQQDPPPTTEYQTTYQNPQNYRRTATPSAPNVPVRSENQFPRQNESQLNMVRPQAYPQAPQQPHPATIPPPAEHISNPTNKNYRYYDSNVGTMQNVRHMQMPGYNAPVPINASGDMQPFVE